jgi:hypothetical protein
LLINDSNVLGEDSNLLTKVEGEIDWIIVGVGGRFVVCISNNALGVLWKDE